MFSLIISCKLFAQSAITLPELQMLEVRMMPFDIRLRTAPYTIQTVSKNKPLTTEVLKDYIVAGSNLKFIAQDKAGLPIGNNTDARIIISENGNSIRIAPKGYTANTTPSLPIELYQSFASKPDLPMVGYNFKAKQLYERQVTFSVDQSPVVVMQSQEFDQIASISIRMSYQDLVSQRILEYNVGDELPTYVTKIYNYDRINKEIAVLPFQCGVCDTKKVEINIKFTKP